MSFSVDLEQFAKETGLELELVVRKLSLEAYNSVTLKTPVDTGRARGNWNIGVGNADLSTTDQTNAQRPSLAKGDGEKVIYITNNLPYIERLEDGWSKQTPRGMVGVTMIELSNAVRLRNVLR